jgi:Tol biopolymer transport system component
MVRSRRVARRRSLLVTIAVAATIAVAVTPAWGSFPNQGSRVVFARAKSVPTRAPLPERGAGIIDLFSMKTNGDDQVRIVKTDTVVEYGGHWSPNGTRLVHAGSKGKGQIDVFTSMADGTKRKQLTTTAANYGPNWSRNGAQIVWTRFSGAARTSSSAARRGTGANLMVMNADGTDKHSILSDMALSPGWSPTAGRIAFSTFDGDSLDVWWIKPNGLDLEQLTNFGVNTYTMFGDWSPDGESFLVTYSSAIKTRGGPVASMYLAEPGGGKPLFLASDVEQEFAPIFSADGSRAIFVRSDGNDYELWSVKTDGTHESEKQLTDNGTDDFTTYIPLV